MALVLVFFSDFGSAIALCPPKSGYPSTEVSYFDFEFRFLVAADTQIKIQSKSGFVRVSMDKGN